MVSVGPKKTYTDGQLKSRLTSLDADQQHEFLRRSDPFFEKESDIYLDALAQSRSALAQALAEIQKDIGGNDEDDDAQDEADETAQLGSKARLFDTSTQIGQHMAAISQAFAELLQDTETGDAKVMEKVHRAEVKAMKKYLKDMESNQGDETEDENGKQKRVRSGKKKHKKDKHAHKNDADEELINSLKETLESDLINAAKEEQEAIMQKMKIHGKNIDRERKRQRQKLDERIREARGQKTLSSDSAYADKVDSLMDRKKELDDMHQQDRSRQENALKSRLKDRKRVESMSQDETGVEGGTGSKKTKAKNKNPTPDLGNAEERIEESEGHNMEPSIEMTVNELDRKDKKTKRKSRKTDEPDQGAVEQPEDGMQQ